MTDKLRTLKADETVSRTRKVFDEGRKVKATFTITYDKKSYAVEDAVFDFSDCSQEDILGLAMRAAVIATQSRAKVAMRSNLGGALERSNWAVIDVKKDIVDTERRAASPVDKAATLLGKMSAEDRAALLAMLKAA